MFIWISILAILSYSVELAKGDKFNYDTIKGDSTVLPSIDADNNIVYGCQSKPNCGISVYSTLGTCENGCEIDMTFHIPSTDVSGSAMVYYAAMDPVMQPGGLLNGFGIQLSLYNDTYRTPELEFFVPSGSIYKSAPVNITGTTDIIANLKVYSGEYSHTVFTITIGSNTTSYDYYDEITSVSYSTAGVFFASDGSDSNDISIVGLDLNGSKITDLQQQSSTGIKNTDIFGQLYNPGQGGIDKMEFTSNISSSAFISTDDYTNKALINPQGETVTMHKILNGHDMNAEISFDIEQIYGYDTDGYFRFVFGEYTSAVDTARNAAPSDPVQSCETRLCFIIHKQILILYIDGDLIQLDSGNIASDLATKMNRVHMSFTWSNDSYPTSQVTISINDYLSINNFSPAADITNGNPYLSFEFKGGESSFLFQTPTIIFKKPNDIAISDITKTSDGWTSYDYADQECDAFTLLDGSSTSSEGAIRVQNSADFNITSIAFEVQKSVDPTYPGGSFYVLLGTDEDFDGATTNGAYIKLNFTTPFPTGMNVESYYPTMIESSQSQVKYRSWNSFVAYVDGTELTYYVNQYMYTMQLPFPLANKIDAFWGIEFRAEGQKSLVKVRNIRFGDSAGNLRYVYSGADVVASTRDDSSSSNMVVNSPLLTNPSNLILGPGSTKNTTSELTDIKVKKLTAFNTGSNEYYVIGPQASYYDRTTTVSHIRVTADDPFFTYGNVTYDVIDGPSTHTYDTYMAYGSNDDIVNLTENDNVCQGYLCIHGGEYGYFLRAYRNETAPSYSQNPSSSSQRTSYHFSVDESSAAASILGNDISGQSTYSAGIPQNGTWAFIMRVNQRATLFNVVNRDIDGYFLETVAASTTLTDNIYSASSQTTTSVYSLTVTTTDTYIIASIETFVTDYTPVQTVGAFYSTEVTDIVTTTYATLVATTLATHVATETVTVKGKNTAGIAGIAVGGSLGAAAALAAVALVAKYKIFDKAINEQGRVPDFTADTTSNNPFYNNPIKYTDSEIYDTLGMSSPPEIPQEFLE